MSSVFGVCGWEEGSFPVHSKAKCRKNKRTRYWRPRSWAVWLWPDRLSISAFFKKQWMLTEHQPVAGSGGPKRWALSLLSRSLSSACFLPPYRIVGGRVDSKLQFLHQYHTGLSHLSKKQQSGSCPRPRQSVQAACAGRISLLGSAHCCARPRIGKL